MTENEMEKRLQQSLEMDDKNQINFVSSIKINTDNQSDDSDFLRNGDLLNVNEALDWIKNNPL